MSTNVQMYDEAIELQQQGKLDEAVARLEALLKQDPNYALAHAALSVFCDSRRRSWRPDIIASKGISIGCGTSMSASACSTRSK